MSRYIRVGVGLSTKQKHQLHRHGYVRLSHRDLQGGPDEIHVTKRHARQMHQSMKKGCACTIKMAPSVHKYNLRHGSGFWSDLWDGVKQGASFVADNALPLLPLLL